MVDPAWDASHPQLTVYGQQPVHWSALHLAWVLPRRTHRMLCERLLATIENTCVPFTAPPCITHRAPGTPLHIKRTHPAQCTRHTPLPRPWGNTNLESTNKEGTDVLMTVCSPKAYFFIFSFLLLLSLLAICIKCWQTFDGIVHIFQWKH